MRIETRSPLGVMEIGANGEVARILAIINIGLAGFVVRKVVSGYPGAATMHPKGLDGKLVGQRTIGNLAIFFAQ